MLNVNGFFPQSKILLDNYCSSLASDIEIGDSLRQNSANHQSFLSQNFLEKINQIFVQELPILLKDLVLNIKNIFLSIFFVKSQLNEATQTIKTNCDSFEETGELNIVTVLPKPYRHYEENVRLLELEFEKGLYIRTFSDAQDEFEQTIIPKHLLEQESGDIESRYWSSAATIQKGSGFTCWTPQEGISRCGLLISSKAELGGWCSHDMATPNPPHNLSNEEKKNYFPANFPPVNTLEIFSAIETNDGLVRKILNLSSQEKIQPETRNMAIDKILEILDTNRLDAIPEDYKSIFTFTKAQEKMKNLSTGICDQINFVSEGKIRYLPEHILGIFVDKNNPNSVRKSKILKEKLISIGMDVPYVKIPQLGSIEVCKQIA